MMNVPRLGSLFRGTLATLLVAGVGPVAAQNAAVITGKVTSERGDALGGATVVVVGTSYGASSGPTGTYSITVPAEVARGQTVTLTARFLGYRPMSRQVTLNPGTQEQNFALATDPLRLEELVVTGVSEATSTRKLTFSVGKVTEAQLQEVPGTSAVQALQGKVAGVRIQNATGEPGAAPTIRLRGATSISGNSNPLLIVDGVITRATIADIAGEDIERIEVVKGAAGSSLYGSDAANGVIQIFTKRGRNLADGKLQVTARIEGGASFLPKSIPNANAHAFVIDDNGDYVRNASGSRVSKPDGIANNPYKTYYNQQDLVIGAGPFYNGYFSVGQRKGSTNFNASFQNTKNEGIIFNLGGYERQNYRINIDQQLAPRLDASFSAFYGQSKNGRAFEGPGSAFFGLTFLEPDTDILADNPDGTPYIAAIPDRISNATNPLYTLNNQIVATDRNRFTGAAKGRWRTTDWLTAEASFSYDQEAERNVQDTPFGYLSATGQPTDGGLFKDQLYGRTYNTNATLTALNTWGKITNTTKVAYIYEDQTRDYLSSSSGTYIVKGVPEFSGTDPATTTASSNNQAIRNQNFYLSTGFDINDRYIIDALVRRDGSSLFGPESRWATYYRISGAWRLNEDIKIKGIDEWRLRAAYGTAGLRPGFANQYEVLEPVGGSFRKATLGNVNLKPAQSAELEVGTNIDFGGGKYTFEYSYAKKNTKDQILLVDLPSVVGYAQQWQNTGAIEATTHEVSFGASLINKRNVAWSLNIVGDRTRSVISEWDLAPRLYGFGQMPFAFYQAEGATLGEMRGQRAIKNIDELWDDPVRKAKLDAGTDSPDNYVINEEGYVVTKASWRTVTEKPLDYYYCEVQNEDGSCKTRTNITQIGDANPDFNMSFSSTFNYHRMAITAMVDWTQGGSLYNGTRQWPFFDNRDRVYDQRDRPAEEQKPQQYYNYFYNGLNAQEYFIESGTYVKIKELSVNYTLVRDQLRKVGLGKLSEVRLGIIGRNLFTFTNYSGYDPEVAGLEGDPFQVRIDWFQYPQFRTFTGVVEIAF
jgi:TonB-linked SusC/RagA family outer membrane protein